VPVCWSVEDCRASCRTLGGVDVIASYSSSSAFVVSILLARVCIVLVQYEYDLVIIIIYIYN
jgi:hypothetical protein